MKQHRDDDVPNTPITRKELMDALQALPQAPDYEQESNENGPVKSPTNRYYHVPETTRLWLEGLRADDTKEIDDVRRWYRNSRVITAFAKWVVVAVVGTLVATGQIGQVIFNIISYFK